MATTAMGGNNGGVGAVVAVLPQHVLLIYSLFSKFLIQGSL